MFNSAPVAVILVPSNVSVPATLTAPVNVAFFSLSKVRTSANTPAVLLSAPYALVLNIILLVVEP